MNSEIFEKLLDISEELLIVTDINFVCKYATKEFFSFFELNETDLIEHSVLEFLTDDYSEEILHNISYDIQFLSSKLSFASDDFHFSISIQPLSDFKEHFYIIRVYKPNFIKDDQLNFLSKGTLELLNKNSTEEIFDYIADKAHSLTTNCYSLCMKYMPESEKMEIVHFNGLGKSMEQLMFILGRNPVGMQFPIHEEAKKPLRDGHLIRGPEDLYTLSSKWLPKFIGNRISKLFGIHKVYLIGITNKDNYVGELVFFLKNNGHINNPELLESFVRNAGMVLDKKITKEKLQESEFRYKKVFSESKIVNLIIDPINLDIVDVNKAACDFYGYTEKELKSMHITDININPVEKIIKDIQLVQKKEENFFFFRHKTKSGSIKDVEVSTGEISFSGKTFIFSQIKDITELLNAKHRLERGEKLTNSGNWEYDMNTNSVYYSQGCKNIYGFENEKMSYSEAMSYTIPEYKELIENSINELVNNNSSYDIKFKIKTTNGQTKNVRNIARYNNEKNIVYGAMQDITEIVKIEQELIEAKESAEKNDKQKSSFLANLSHEIRTPMNAIKGFAEVLKDPDLNVDDINEFIDIINENSEHLLQIINNVLDISKIESGSDQFIFENINLNDFFISISKNYLNRCELKELEFIYEKPDAPCYIYADKSKLKQVCDNILGNSLKFTDKGYVKVGYTCKGENDKVKIYIEDTGIGMPEDKVGKIFERFFQIEENYSGTNTGTGLGLSITKTILDNMNAEISVKSKSGEGSRFEIVFDLVKSVASEKETIKLQNEKYDKLNGLNILIAEDYATNFELLNTILKKYECNIDWAKNGEEAFNMAKTNDYDIILMDIKMPVMDGIVSSGMIKSIKPNIPIIAQTAYAMQDEINRIESSNFNDIVVKPIKRNDLLSKILKNL